MTDLHVLCRHDERHRMENGNAVSGDWSLSARTRRRLFGGRIRIHRRHAAPSVAGGSILEIRYVRTDITPTGRRIRRFEVVYDPDAMDVGHLRTTGWSRDKAIVD